MPRTKNQFSHMVESPHVDHRFLFSIMFICYIKVLFGTVPNLKCTEHFED